jgi:hypothetical protein
MKLIPSALLSLIFLLPHETYAACHVQGEASISDSHQYVLVSDDGSSDALGESGPRPAWDDSSEDTKQGTDFKTSMGSYEGTDLVYRGGLAGNNQFSSEASHSWGGSRTTAWSFLEVSINWTPHQREECIDHKFDRYTQKRRCVKKALFDDPTSFSVEIFTNDGTQHHYTKVFQNINSRQRATISMPGLACDGPITNYEVRISNLTGGSVEFRLHRALFRGAWKY